MCTSPGTSSVVTMNSSPLSSTTGRPVAKRPEPDLRALKVDQDPDPSADGVGRRPDVVVDGQVLLVPAMRQVEPGHVHARLDEALDLLQGAGGRAEGGNDLRATHDEQPIRKRLQG